MMPLTQLEREREDQAKESRGQNEDLQAILAKLHLRNKWRRESSSMLHRGHKEFARGMRKTTLSLALEGRRFQAIFHSRSLSLAFSLSFQRSFHYLGSKGVEKEETL